MPPHFTDAFIDKSVTDPIIYKIIRITDTGYDPYAIIETLATQLSQANEHTIAMTEELRKINRNLKSY